MKITPDYLTSAVFNDNPIVRAEDRNLRGVDRPGFHWRRWLVNGVCLIALGLALIVFGGEVIGVILGRDTTPIYRALDGIPMAALMIVAALGHLLILLRILVQASASVAREKRAATWEPLVLTHITSRQLVFGKWWATVRSMRRWLLWLALLHAAVAVMVATIISRDFPIFMATTPLGGVHVPVFYYRIIPPDLLGILLTGALSLAHVLLAAGMVAAVGVLASVMSRDLRRALAAGVGLLALLAGLVFLGLAVPTTILGRHCYLLNGEANTDCSNAVSTLDDVAYDQVDNGTSLSSYPSYYQVVSPDGQTNYSAPNGTQSPSAGVALSLILYVVLTWGVLGLAQRRAVRQGVSPEHSR